MTNYSIYGLTDPDTGAVRYIGATRVSASARFSQIKYGYKRGQFQDIGAWIWALAESGKAPGIIILEQGTPDGINGEKRWIAAHRQAGAQLFNKSDGGQGTNGVMHTEEWKLNNSKILTGLKRTQETKDKIAASKIGKPRPDLASRNISNRSLSPADIAEIRSMLDEGYTMKDIGASFGVSGALICLIKSGKRYAS